jgi:hypothetical protein
LATETERRGSLVLEQRAWRGVRLCAKTHIRKAGVDDRDFYVEIGYHYPRKQFYVEVDYTYLEPGNGACDFPTERGTYGGTEHFALSVDECIRWIEVEFDVKVILEGPKIAQEAEWLRELRKEEKVEL